MADKILEIRDLEVSFKTEQAMVYAINGINLTIESGESIGLVGESGAGKTTTALSILNLLSQNANIKGDVLFHDKSVFSMKKKELTAIRGSKISMIFQNPLTALNPVFTVGEQIAMVLRAHKHMKYKEASIGAGKLLELVGIPSSRIQDYPNQFSGGMRQRVGIAASLACNPEILIADEPTTALDVTVQAQILELMKDLQKKYSTSLLMITHNLGIISELCEKVVVMYAGKFIEYGPVCKVFANPMHPYTRGLLGALPKLNEERKRLVAIPGRIANPQDLPKGCEFNPRCQHCTEKCRNEKPVLLEVEDGHYCACFNMVKGGDV